LSAPFVKGPILPIFIISSKGRGLDNGQWGFVANAKKILDRFSPELFKGLVYDDFRKLKGNCFGCFLSTNNFYTKDQRNGQFKTYVTTDNILEQLPGLLQISLV
jgi:hypothetical protein